MDVLLWGAKGHALVLSECLERLDHRLVGVFDNDAGVRSPFPELPVGHGMAALRQLLRDRASDQAPPVFAVAIGGARGADRLAVAQELGEAGLVPLTVVHPTAFVARDARLGAGAQVLALAGVAASAQLGDQVIVNTAASVDHECRVGDGAHVGPGARVAGCVEIGARAFLGVGAVVLPGLSIGADAVVGAGAVVTRPVPDAAVVVGNPARVVR